MGHTLDLLMVRSGDDIIHDIIVKDHGFPDHYAVSCNLQLFKPPPQSKKVEYRKIKDLDINAFCADLAGSTLTTTGTDAPLDSLVSDYNSKLTTLLDKHAPVRSKVIRMRTKVEWYTDKIREAKRKRRQLERLWRKSKLTVHHQMYSEQRNHVNRLITSAKAEYYTGKVQECENDTKRIFKVISSLLGKEQSQSLPEHDSLAKLTESFNEFFIQKISLIRESLEAKQTVQHPLENNDCLPEGTTTLCVFEPASLDEIHKLVISSPTKSCSLDPVPTDLLKKTIHLLGPNITQMINMSLNTGIFPDSLKSAIVRPLLKKQSLDPNIMKNYRPVSNLAFISKVLEKVVAARITSYLFNHNLAEPFQSAYRKGCSTETALTRVQNDILVALGNKHGVLLVLLDLSAAFDTVDHRTLLDILQNLGIRNICNKWFQSYLDARSQCVSIQSTSSSTKILHHGVPQGSVLGPVLFTIYTSSLGKLLRHVNINFHLYADDTQLYLLFYPKDQESVTSAYNHMENCLKHVQTWMDRHFLKLNQDKTEILLITPKNQQTPNVPPLTIGTSNILPSHHARNIGVIMDSHATMERHINSVCRGAYFHLRNIAKIKTCLTKTALQDVTRALITTKLDYCNSILYGLPKYLTLKLQRVQNSAARMIMNIRKRDHITPVLQRLHWLPVHQRIKFKILVLVHKALMENNPSYLQDLLQSYIPNRSLRSAGANLLVVPHSKSKLYHDRAFSFAGPSLWNSLPAALRDIISITSFKSKLKTLLFTEAYPDL